MASTADDFAQQELRDILEELLQAWQADRGGAFQTKAHVAVFGTVYGLTAHAHRLGGAVAELTDSGRHLETVPIVRAAFEAAIMASWIGHVPDALPAFMNRQANQQKALRDSAVLAEWVPKDEPLTIPADNMEPYTASAESREAAKKTFELCNDLLNGHSLYTLYRGLSWLTHPTAAITDYYMELPDGAAIPTLRDTPKLEPEFMRTWLHITCSSLVWSARILNLKDAERASKPAERHRLRKAAERLGIPEFLEAKPGAIQRGEKSERKRANENRA